MDKAHNYQKLVGRTHVVREELRERWTSWKEEHPLGLIGSFKEAIGSKIVKPDPTTLTDFSEYTHVFRLLNLYFYIINVFIFISYEYNVSLYVDVSFILIFLLGPLLTSLIVKSIKK